MKDEGAHIPERILSRGVFTGMDHCAWRGTESGRRCWEGVEPRKGRMWEEIQVRVDMMKRPADEIGDEWKGGRGRYGMAGIGVTATLGKKNE